MLSKKYILIVISAFLFSQGCSAFNISNTATFIFAHGFGGNERQVDYYNGKRIGFSIVPDKHRTFNFPEVVVTETKDAMGLNKLSYTVDATKANFAQKGDITALKSTCDASCGDIVLVGLSRGAATILNYAAQYPENIKALVVEAPFGCIETILTNKLGKATWIPGSTSLAHTAFNTMYKSYDKNGPKPITEIRKLNKNIPVLLIHSKQDALIPVQSSKSLYKLLKSRGHKDVYLLILNTGEHANYQSGFDAKKYEATVHAFYAKYNLPHDAKLAEKGKNYLEKCKI